MEDNNISSAGQSAKPAVTNNNGKYPTKKLNVLDQFSKGFTWQDMSIANQSDKYDFEFELPSREKSRELYQEKLGLNDQQFDNFYDQTVEEFDAFNKGAYNVDLETHSHLDAITGSGSQAWLNMRKGRMNPSPIERKSMRYGIDDPLMQFNELRYTPSMIARRTNEFLEYNPDTGEYESNGDISKWDYFIENLNPSSKIIAKQFGPEDYRMVLKHSGDLDYHMDSGNQMSIWGAQRKRGFEWYDMPAGIVNGLVFETGEMVGRMLQLFGGLFTEDATDMPGVGAGIANWFGALQYKPSEQIESAGFFGSGAAFAYNMSKMISMLIPQKAVATATLKGSTKLAKMFSDDAVELITKEAGKKAKYVLKNKKAQERIARFAATGTGTTQAVGAFYEEALASGLSHKDASRTSLAALPIVAMTEYLIGSKWITGNLDPTDYKNGVRASLKNVWRETAKGTKTKVGKKAVNNAAKKGANKAAKDQAEQATKSFVKNYTSKVGNTLKKAKGLPSAKQMGRGIAQGMKEVYNVAARAPITRGVVREGAQEGSEEAFYVAIQAAHDDLFENGYLNANKHGYTGIGDGLFGTEWFGKEEMARVLDNALAGAVLGGFADPILNFNQLGGMKGIIDSGKEALQKESLQKVILKAARDEDSKKIFIDELQKRHKAGKLAPPQKGVDGEFFPSDKIEEAQQIEIKDNSVPGFQKGDKLKTMNDLVYYQTMKELNYVEQALKISGVNESFVKNYEGSNSHLRKTLDLSYRMVKAQEALKNINSKLSSEKIDPSEKEVLEKEAKQIESDIQNMSELKDYFIKPVVGNKSQAELEDMALMVFNAHRTEEENEYTIEDVKEIINNEDLRELKVKKIREYREKEKVANEINQEIADLIESEEFADALTEVGVNPEAKKKSIKAINSAINSVAKKIEQSNISLQDINEESRSIVNFINDALNTMGGEMNANFTGLSESITGLLSKGQNVAKTITGEYTDEQLAEQATREYFLGELESGIAELNRKYKENEGLDENDMKKYNELVQTRKRVKSRLTQLTRLKAIQDKTGYEYLQNDSTNDSGEFVPGNNIDDNIVDGYNELINDPTVYFADNKLANEFLNTTPERNEETNDLTEEMSKRSPFDIYYIEDGFVYKRRDVNSDGVVAEFKVMPDGSVQYGYVSTSGDNKGKVSEWKSVQLKEDESIPEGAELEMKMVGRLMNKAAQKAFSQSEINKSNPGAIDIQRQYSLDDFASLFGNTIDQLETKEKRRIFYKSYIKNNILASVMASIRMNPKFKKIDNESEAMQTLLEKEKEVDQIISEMHEAYKSEERVLESEDVDKLNKEITEFELLVNKLLLDNFSLKERTSLLSNEVMDYFNSLQNNKTNNQILRHAITYDQLEEVFGTSDDDIENHIVLSEETLPTSPAKISMFLKSGGNKHDYRYKIASYMIRETVNLLNDIYNQDLNANKKKYRSTLDEFKELNPSVDQAKAIQFAFARLTQRHFITSRESLNGHFSDKSIPVLSNFEYKNTNREDIDPVYNKFHLKGVNIFGSGGAGKTTVMLKAIMHMYSQFINENNISANKKHILLVGPDATITEKMKESLKGTSLTYDTITYSEYISKVQSGNIGAEDYNTVVIDEASKMSGEEASSLIKHYNDKNTHFLMLSDPKQASGMISKGQGMYNLKTPNSLILPRANSISEIFRTDVADIASVQNAIDRNLDFINPDFEPLPSTKYNAGHTKGVQQVGYVDDVKNIWLDDLDNKMDADKRVIIFATSSEADKFIESLPQDKKDKYRKNVRYINKDSNTNSDSAQGSEFLYVYSAVMDGAEKYDFGQRKIFKTATSRAQKYLLMVGDSAKSQERADSDIIDTVDANLEEKKKKKYNEMLKAQKAFYDDITTEGESRTESEEDTKEKKSDTKEEKTVHAIFSDERISFPSAVLSSYDINYESDNNGPKGKEYVGETFKYELPTGAQRNVKVLDYLKGVKTTDGKSKNVFIVAVWNEGSEPMMGIVSTTDLHNKVKNLKPVEETNLSEVEEVEDDIKINDSDQLNKKNEAGVLNSARSFSKDGRLRILPYKNISEKTEADKLYSEEDIDRIEDELTNAGELRVKWENVPSAMHTGDGMYEPGIVEGLVVRDSNNTVVGFLFNPENINVEDYAEEDQPLIEKYIAKLNEIKRSREPVILAQAKEKNHGYVTYHKYEESGTSQTWDNFKQRLSDNHVTVYSKKKKAWINPNNTSGSNLKIEAEKDKSGVFRYYIEASYDQGQTKFRIYLNNKRLSQSKELKTLEEDIESLKEKMKNVSDLESKNKLFKNSILFKYFLQNQNYLFKSDGKLRNDYKSLFNVKKVNGNERLYVNWNNQSSSDIIDAIFNTIKSKGYTVVKKNENNDTFIYSSDQYFNVDQINFKQFESGIKTINKPENPNKNKSSKNKLFYETSRPVKQLEMSDMIAEKELLAELLGDKINDYLEIEAYRGDNIWGYVEQLSGILNDRLVLRQKSGKTIKNIATHEAVHFVLRNMVSKNSANAIIDSVKKEMVRTGKEATINEISNRDAEEYLANKAMNYKPKKSKGIKALWEKFVGWVNHLFGNTIYYNDHIRFLSDLKNGKFQNASINANGYSVNDTMFYQGEEHDVEDTESLYEEESHEMAEVFGSEKNYAFVKSQLNLNVRVLSKWGGFIGNLDNHEVLGFEDVYEALLKKYQGMADPAYDMTYQEYVERYSDNYNQEAFVGFIVNQLKKEEVLQVVFKDMYPSIDTTSEGIEKAHNVFENTDNRSISQYKPKNTKIFTQTLSYMRPTLENGKLFWEDSGERLDEQVVDNVLRSIIDPSQFNGMNGDEILDAFVEKIRFEFKQLQKESVLHEFDYETKTESTRLVESERFAIIGSLLYQIGYDRNSVDESIDVTFEAWKNEEDRLYTPYEFVRGLDKIAEKEGTLTEEPIDLMDPENENAKKLWEIAKAQSSLLNSLVSHYTNTQEQHFISLKYEDSKFSKERRYSTSENEVYKTIKDNISYVMYNGELGLTSHANSIIGDSTGQISVSSDGIYKVIGNERVKYLDYVDGQFTFTEKEDNVIAEPKDIKKLFGNLGINLTNGQADYLLNGYQKIGHTRDGFDRNKLANILGYLYYAIEYQRLDGLGNSRDTYENTFFNNLDTILVKELSKAGQINLQDTEQITMLSFIDNLKDLSAKLASVNAMITDHFYTDKKGKKQYIYTLGNEVSKGINTSTGTMGYFSKTEKLASEMPNRSDHHSFISPSGKVFEPFYETLEFTGHKIMRNFTNGWNSKEVRELSIAENLMADMGIFLESFTSKRKNRIYDVAIQPFGDSNLKVIMEIAQGPGIDGLFHYGEGVVIINEQKLASVFEEYMAQYIHRFAIKLDKLYSTDIFKNNKQKDQLIEYADQIWSLLEEADFKYEDSYQSNNKVDEAFVVMRDAIKYLNEDVFSNNSLPQSKIENQFNRAGLLNRVDYNIKGKKVQLNYGGDDIIGFNSIRDYLDRKKSGQKEYVKKWLNNAFYNRAKTLKNTIYRNNVSLPKEIVGKNNSNSLKNIILGENVNELNPMILAYLGISYITMKSFNNHFVGDTNQAKSIEDYIKRVKKTDGKAYTLVTGGTYGISEKLDTVSLKDDVGMFSELSKMKGDYNQEYEANDSAMLTNPLSALFMANSLGNEMSIVARRDKTFKTLGTGVNDKGLGIHDKMAEFVLNTDMLNFSPEYEQLLRYMLKGGNKNVVSGTDYSSDHLLNLYDKYREEGFELEEAMELIHDEIIKVRHAHGIDLLKLSIGRIQVNSTEKLSHRKQNQFTMSEFLEKVKNGDTEDVIKDEVDYNNTKVILNHNMDLNKESTRMLSQAISSFIAHDNSPNKYGKKVGKLVNAITTKGLTVALNEMNTDFDGMLREKALRSMSSYKGSEALKEKVANPDTSVQIPAVINKTLPSMVNTFNDTINFDMHGWKMVQAPASNMKLFKLKDGSGNDYYASYADAVRYARTEGVEIDKIEAVPLRSYLLSEDGKKIVAPEQVITALPNAKRLGIKKGVSLNEALMFPLIVNGEKKMVNIREFVKRESEDYYRDMSTGIKALEEAITTTMKESLEVSEDGSLMLTKDFFDGAYYLDAINEISTEENRPNLLQPAGISDYFHKLLESTLVMVNRTPHNNWSAGAPVEIVEITHNSGSVIYRPSERTALDDSDYDIDQLTVSFKSFNIDRPFSEQMSAYQDDKLKNKNAINEITNNMYQALMDPENIDLTIMQMGLQDIKDMVRKSFKQVRMFHHDPSTNAIVGEGARAGKEMVAHAANAINVYNRIIAMGAKNIKKYIPGMDIKTNRESIIGSVKVFSEILQLAVDNQNDPVISGLGFNQYTSNLIAAMIMEGKTSTEIFELLQNDQIQTYLKRVVASHNVHKDTNQQTVELIDSVENAIEYLNSLQNPERFNAIMHNKKDEIEERVKQVKSDIANLYGYAAHINNPSEKWTADELAFDNEEEMRDFQEQMDRDEKQYRKYVQLNDEEIRNEVRSEVENELKDQMESLEVLNEVKGYILKGDFINRISQMSFHQGYPVKPADIVMKNQAYERFTGETVTSFNMKPVKVSIEKKFQYLKGYGKAKQSLSQDKVSIQVKNVVKEVEKAFSEKPLGSNVKIITAGQTGVDKGINFDMNTGSGNISIVQNVAKQVVTRDGKKYDGKTYAENTSWNDNVEVKTNDLGIFENIEERIKESDGIVFFEHDVSEFYKKYLMKKAKEHGKIIKFVNINTQAATKDLENALRIISSDAMSKYGKEDYSPTIFVTGENAMTLKHQRETEFEKQMRREKEIHEIGNFKGILNASPQMKTYFEGYVNMNRAFEKNLFIFSKFFKNITNKKFLEPLKQGDFKSKDQFYSYIDSINAYVVDQYFRNTANIDEAFNNVFDIVKEYLPGSLKYRIQDSRIDVNDYMGSRLFTEAFPLIALSLKESTDNVLHNNKFLNSLEIQNGKLVVKNAMAMNPGKISQLKNSFQNIINNHPDVYTLFKSYELLVHGLRGVGNSLSDFMGPDLYEGVSNEYEKLITRAKVEGSNIEHDTHNIETVDLVDMAASFDERVLPYLSKKKFSENRGYNPLYVRRRVFKGETGQGFSYEAVQKYDEERRNYIEMNSKVSKKLKRVFGGEGYSNFTIREVIKPQNYDDLLNFMQTGSATINYGNKVYFKDGIGFYLNKEATITKTGRRSVSIDSIKKRHESRNLNLEEQKALGKKKQAATAMINHIIKANNMQDVIRIVDNNTGKGHLLSYIENGIIHFNIDNMHHDTLMHEFGHILIEAGLNADATSSYGKAARALVNSAKKYIHDGNPVANKVLDQYGHLNESDLVKEIAVTILGFSNINTIDRYLSGFGQDVMGNLILDAKAFEDNSGTKISEVVSGGMVSSQSIGLNSTVSDIADKLIGDLMNGTFALNPAIEQYLTNVRAMNPQMHYLDIEAQSNERKIKGFKEIKEGVPELFESNPELANEVYNALGYNLTLSKNKEADLKRFVKKDKRNLTVNKAIEQWKDENQIKYNPEEIFSRGERIYSEIGRYNIKDINSYLDNLLTNVSDLDIRGFNMVVSAYTGDPKSLKTSKIRFEINPKSEDIIWASATDVASSRTQNASKDLSVYPISFTKAPKTENINHIEPNLANIITKRNNKNNELAIKLRPDNFRIIYDSDVEQSIKNKIDAINKKLSFSEPIITSDKVKPNNNSKNNIIEYYNKIQDIDTSISEKRYKSIYQITPQQKQKAQQLYSQYLDTIFPDSKVKDILYHGALQDKYKGDRSNLSRLLGLWLTSKKGSEYFRIPRNEENNNEFTRDIINTYGANVTDKELYEYHESILEEFYPYIQNNKEKERIIQGYIKAFKSDLNNIGESIPEVINANLKEVDISIWKDLLKEGVKSKIKSFKEQIKKDGYTGIYFKNTDEQFDSGYDQYVVFEPEQIHILGSKQDINGFKEYTKNTPIKPGVSELFESNPELANEIYEALGYSKQINEIADTKKVDEFIKKYKDALPNIKDGKTLISHLQTISNRNTGTTKQFADLIIKLSQQNKSLEKLLNNPNLYAMSNGVGDEGAFYWSLFNNLSTNKIVIELNNFKTSTYDDVFLHELIHNLTTQFIVKDSDLFNQAFYNKVKELYSIFDNHLEDNRKIDTGLVKYWQNDIREKEELLKIIKSKSNEELIKYVKPDGKKYSDNKDRFQIESDTWNFYIADFKDVKNIKNALISKVKDVIADVKKRFKELEIEKGSKDYYYFNSKSFENEDSVLSEFLATFINNAEFREQLKTIDYKNNKSLFQKIVDLIGEFLGLTKNESLYNEFVLNLTKFINDNDYSSIAKQTVKTAYENRINLLEQQKQRAQQLYSQYLEQGGKKQDIKGFKEFVRQNKQKMSSIQKEASELDNSLSDYEKAIVLTKQFKKLGNPKSAHASLVGDARVIVMGPVAFSPSLSPKLSDNSFVYTNDSETGSVSDVIKKLFNQGKLEIYC